ncbi:uncharacterized protein LOC130720580 isoform X2 [Lotus japonicus]|uniref:uncharacterized protein LOC130720580 isoform X2 n=1 Tax=Lotus japonicus TaxID=34305 RepID=UPI002591109F|nr:uncharacterized protein LOC130720580 isoform X2 [Lotus japonicus]
MPAAAAAPPRATLQPCAPAFGCASAVLISTGISIGSKNSFGNPPRTCIGTEFCYNGSDCRENCFRSGYKKGGNCFVFALTGLTICCCYE